MKIKFLVLSMAATLAACGGSSSDNVDEVSGGGGSSESSGPSAEYQSAKEGVLAQQGLFDQVAEPGIYSIVLTNESDNTTSKGTALIASSGRIASYFDEYLSYQFILDQASSWEGGFSLTSNRKDIGKAVLGASPGKLEHTGDNSELTADVTGSGDLADYTYRIFQGPQNTPVAIADMQGVYIKKKKNGLELSLEVKETGEIVGNDSSGCDYYGEILVSPENSQTFEGVLEKTGCTENVEGDFPAIYKNGVYLFQGLYNKQQGSISLFPQKRSPDTDLIFDIISVTKIGHPEQDVDQAFSSGYISEEFTVVDSVVDYMPVGLVYNTTFSVDGDTVTTNGTGFGIVSPTGRIVFSNSEFSGYARIEIDDAGTYTAPIIIAGPVTINSVLIEQEPRILDGFPTEAVVINGPDAETGALEYRTAIDNADINQGDTLTSTDIDRVYTSVDGATPNRQFQINGQTITGEDDGCMLTGEVVQPDPGIPVFEAQMTATACSPNENATAAEREGVYHAVIHFSLTEDVADTSVVAATPVMRMIYTNDIVNSSFIGQ